jgi:hypothetical protein
MLGWALVLGPLGILAYRYRWARAAFFAILGAVFVSAGGRNGVAIGLAFLVLAAAPILVATIRRDRPDR